MTFQKKKEKKAFHLSKIAFQNSFGKLRYPKKCRIIHGTTLVANALIERKGVKTALLTTKGFKDVLEIGKSYDFKILKVLLDVLF